MNKSTTWMKYEPQRRKGAMEAYKDRFVVILAPGMDKLYLSDKILGKLIKPDYLDVQTDGKRVGLSVGTKLTGYRVTYKDGVTIHITIKKFVEEFPFEPGVYECEVEQGMGMNKGVEFRYDIIVFNRQSHPSQQRVQELAEVAGNGHKPN